MSSDRCDDSCIIPKNFCEIIDVLRDFWGGQQCSFLMSHDVPSGAGTYHPATFFGALQQDTRISYVSPSRRPQDGRYGESPNRMYQHHQFQVLLRPSPEFSQELVYHSFARLGIDKKYDIRFVDNNWESPVLGASGVGWEVWVNGLEVLQYTYFQKIGGIELNPTAVEYAYGLERLALIVNDSEDVMKVMWDRNLSYGEIRKLIERQQSAYTFESTDIPKARERMCSFMQEAVTLVGQKLHYPAYENFLFGVHEFNKLHACGALGVGERANMVLELRQIACSVAESAGVCGQDV